MRLLALLLLPTGAFAQLPEVVSPPGNPQTPEKIALGKALFWDEQLSESDEVACGTCHRPEAGGSDPRTFAHPGIDQILGTEDDTLGSPGTPGRGTPRRPRSVIGAAFGFELFWDGRAGEEFVDPLTGEVLLDWGAALETQSLKPILHPDEMGLDHGWGWPEVTAKLAKVTPLRRSPEVPGALSRWIDGRGYPELFEETFGDEAITPARIAMAIAAYERTLIPDRAPVVLEPGGGPSWSAQELEGLRVFRSLNCANCHLPGDGLYTDHSYHFLGTASRRAEPGLQTVTGLVQDGGHLQTPSLLNVSLRAPFFHNGSQATLMDVVEFYQRGGDHEPNAIGRLNMTLADKEALVVFLGRPMTDPRVLAGSPPFDRPLLFREVPDRLPIAAGVLRLHETPRPGGAAVQALFTWNGYPEDGAAPGGYLPVEFSIPDRAVLVGRTIEAAWIGPLAGERTQLTVRLQPDLPR